MARTISVPQRSGTLSDPLLYETISRVVAGINSALTVSTAASMPTSPSGTLAPTNPVVRLVGGGGSIRTIAPVDFDVPIYLIATTNSVTLEVGGNIGSTVTIAVGTVCALIPDKTTGLWWPISGGGAAPAPSATTFRLTSSPVAYGIGWPLSSAGALIQMEADTSLLVVDPTGAGYSISNLTRNGGVYHINDLVYVENMSSTDSFDLNNSGGVNGIVTPSGAAFTLGPKYTALLRYRGSQWALVIAA